MTYFLSVWTIPEAQVDIFVNFANSFHPTIKFACEKSSTDTIFLDTKVYKGPRFPTTNILDVQTHFKPTETFQYTHFSSCHPLSVKKGFIKGEALRLLKTNSVKESFKNLKREFESRLYLRGYPQNLVRKILTEVQFSSRQSALRNKTRTSRPPLPFVTTYNPAGQTESQKDSYDKLALLISLINPTLRGSFQTPLWSLTERKNPLKTI